MMLTSSTGSRRMPAWARRLTLASRGGFIAAWVVLASSCESPQFGQPVASTFRPETDGFHFPNFRSVEYEETFDAAAFVTMVGPGPRVCVQDDGDVQNDGDVDHDGGFRDDGDPCVLTEEAAEFASTVNELRADGHCEGMVVLAAVRFNQGASRPTVEIPDDAQTINAIIRAFVTMFLPEVQAEARYWMSESLADLITVLTASLAENRMEFGLGIYMPEGGHEVLPFAIEYPRPDLARIMVYDPNWPMQARYVDVDLANERWTFSFSAPDPSNDVLPWTGGPRDLDLNAVTVRVNALNRIRSEDLDPVGTIWE